MENAALTLGKYFTVCATCHGWGIASADSAASRFQSCPVCQGTGLSLNLPSEDFVLSLPLFVDFASRRRVKIVRGLLIVILLTFLLGLPYLIFIYLLNFWQSFKAVL